MTALTIQPQSLQNKHAVQASSPLAILGISLATIVSISAIDIWFAVENDSILRIEQNPICLALMNLDPSGFKFFIAGKVSGTAMVICSLIQLHRRKYRHAMMVTLAITAFQVGLLIYLTLSDPLTHNLPNFSLLFNDTSESIWELTYPGKG